MQKEAVAAAEPGSAKAGTLLTLVEPQRKSGDVTHAWETLRECADATPPHRFWKEGDREMHGVTRLWMDGVPDAAITAVEHAGDLHLRTRYLTIRDTELRAPDRSPVRSGPAARGPAKPDRRSTTSRTRYAWPPPWSRVGHARNRARHLDRWLAMAMLEPVGDEVPDRRSTTLPRGIVPTFCRRWKHIGPP